MKIELLERAAAAVGIEHRGWVDSATDGTGLAVPGSPDIALVTRSGSEYGWWIWNPWDDNGDAFCLALHRGVLYGVEHPWLFVATTDGRKVKTPLGGAPGKAEQEWLRERIVRAVVAQHDRLGERT